VIFVSALIVLLDQVTKLMVKGISLPALGIAIDGMRYGASRPVLGDFFRLTYIENPGMAFGINVGDKPFFAVVSIVASAAIIFYLYRSRNEPLGFRFSLAMILGGALGNLIDRVFYGVLFNEGALFHGKVVDFFDVDFFNISIWGYTMNRWPVFNIADASVTVGVLLLVLLYRGGTPRREQTAGTSAATNGFATPEQSEHT
jgi:signal peptidase II